MIYDITPCPKPRMTRSDKWKRRPCVLRYLEFKDECRRQGVKLAEFGDHIVFFMPMPKSWSKKKRAEMNGEPHRQKPDLDNLLKALQDAVADEDCGIWHYSGLAKIWTDGPGRIRIARSDGQPTSIAT